MNTFVFKKKKRRWKKEKEVEATKAKGQSLPSFRDWPPTHVDIIN